MEVSLNFGAISSAVYRYSAAQLVSEATNKNVLKDFIKEIRNSPSLQIQYLIFKNLDNGFCKTEHLADRYISENLKLANKLNWRDILIENKRLRKKILEDFNINPGQDKYQIYEAIHVLIESTTKQDFKDINRSEEAYDVVLTHLLNNMAEASTTEKEAIDRPALFNWRFVTEKAISNFNLRYNHLNESERQVVKVLLSPDKEKKLYIEHLLSENDGIISSLLNQNEDKALSESLNKFKDKMNTIAKAPLININENLVNLTELNNSLKEI